MLIRFPTDGKWVEEVWRVGDVPGGESLWVEEVGRLVLYAVRQCVRGQRLNAEENDRYESHDDGEDGDEEGRTRRVRVLEQLPHSTQVRVARHRRHLHHNVIDAHLVPRSTDVVYIIAAMRPSVKIPWTLVYFHRLF